MKLTLHTENVAQTEDGEWVGRNPDTGAWEPIDKPAGIVIKLERRKDRAPAHPMTDPYERDAKDVRRVWIRRYVYRNVPDYEAELLLRHGWEITTNQGGTDAT